jgi:hypothetical protein
MGDNGRNSEVKDVVVTLLGAEQLSLTTKAQCNSKIRSSGSAGAVSSMLPCVAGEDDVASNMSSVRPVRTVLMTAHPGWSHHCIPTDVT